MATEMRGIYPVLGSPFDEQGQLEHAGLRSQVDFCLKCGAHGLVYPVLGAEFQFLSEEERQGGLRTVIGTADGRVPVVAGVAAPAVPLAASYARDAATAGAQAVIALPPYVSPATPAELFDYYRAIASAGLPVFIQNAQNGMAASFVAELIDEIELIQYVKEEQPPSAHNLSIVLETLKDKPVGVFGGAFGRWMLSEMERGACGFMPASDTVDVFVAIWDAWQAGDKKRARDIFDALVPLINLYTMLGFAAFKYILVKRGVIAHARTRTPGAVALDAADVRELDLLWERLAPHLKV